MALPNNKPKNIGKKFVIGLPGGQTVTGLVRETVDRTNTADVEMVRDEDNAEVAAIVSNPGKRLAVAGVMAEDLADQIAPGAVVTAAGKEYLVEASAVSYARTLARFTMTLYAPDAMEMTVQVAAAGDAKPTGAPATA